MIEKHADKQQQWAKPLTARQLAGLRGGFDLEDYAGGGTGSGSGGG